MCAGSVAIISRETACVRKAQPPKQVEQEDVAMGESFGASKRNLLKGPKDLRGNG